MLRHECSHRPFSHGVCQHARNVSDRSSLADARPTKQQDVTALFHQPLDHGSTALYHAARTARQAHNASRAVADRADAVQRLVDPGSVVRIKLSDLEGSAIRWICIGLCSYHALSHKASDCLEEDTRIRSTRVIRA